MNASKNQMIFFKCSNLYERCGMFWNERKIIFQIFPIFIFRVRVILYSKYCKFSMNFDDNSWEKNRIFFFDFHSFQNVSQLFISTSVVNLFSTLPYRISDVIIRTIKWEHFLKIYGNVYIIIIFSNKGIFRPCPRRERLKNPPPTLSKMATFFPKDAQYSETHAERISDFFFFFA